MDIDPAYAEALFSKPPAEQDRPPTHRRIAMEQIEQEDIYRGEPPSPPRSPPPRPPSVSSASSSSGWSGLGLRRGALGAVLELAINRWARASSGSSTSSTSSVSSVHTQLPRRRRRRSSNATTLNARSESIIRARRKARDEYRVLQREFTLFLPAALIPNAPHAQSLRGPPVPSQLPYDQRRILRTPSLSLVLAQLDSAVKRSAKLRRPKQLRGASPGAVSEPNGYSQFETPSTISQLDALQQDKGKAREEPRMTRSPMRVGAEPVRWQQAWWLDVSSPTWSDLREIGKVLHLHPLTLEDVLHQDPREKLELFPRLGYYFIVFRALESKHTQPSAGAQTNMKAANDAVPFKDNAISGTNVYIVVFRDGICSFHFEDIEGHAERVRNKILQLEETIHMSSDWIAHGILDSIVDDFFPMLHSIEQEIKYLDDLLLSDGQPTKKRFSQTQPEPLMVDPGLEKTSDLSIAEDKEKAYSAGSEHTPMLRRRFDGGRTLSFLLTSLTRSGAVLNVPYLKQWIPFLSRSPQPPPPSPLMRMASSRRLVTSLARLLGTKSEVISQIRKRLTNGASAGPKSGPFEKALAVEVGIYFGDIQDHILTLQHSLAHYERMLSHSHPAYLSHLRVSLSKSKGGMDKALVTLSVISVTVLAMQLVTGMFSTNLGNLPHNTRPDPDDDTPQPNAPFNVFGAVLAGVVLIGAGTISLARYWWLLAKRKYARRTKF